MKRLLRSVQESAGVVVTITLFFALGVTGHLLLTVTGSDHPVRSMPVLKIILLSSHTTLFLFLFLFLFVILLLFVYTLVRRVFERMTFFLYDRILLKILRRAPSVKAMAQKYILLLYLLPLAYFSKIISQKILGSPLLPRALLLLLYPALIMTALLLRNHYKNAQAKREEFFTAFSALAALPLPFELFYKLYARYDVQLAGEITLLTVLLAAASYAVARFGIVGFLSKLCSVLLCALLILSLSGFLWETKKRELSEKRVSSRARDDVNVLVIVYDSLRADHLGCYGYKRQTSPRMDKFAQEGILFRHCYSSASWTIPSVASLFSSLHPSMHGTTFHVAMLPDEITTFAEIMKQAGYVTYGYTANSTLKKIFNFHQGFDFYDDYLLDDTTYYMALRSLPFFRFALKKMTRKKFNVEDRIISSVVNARVIPWLEKYKDENFFMYLHYMDTHTPYRPPPCYRNLYPYARADTIERDAALYDGEIRFADDNLSILFEKLKSLGIYEKTLIVVTSDHGEEFADHSYAYLGHGYDIYQNQVHVPLIMKPANALTRHRVFDTQVGLIDLMPSILDLLRIPLTAQVEGKSFAPLLRGEPLGEFHDYLYIDNDFDGVFIHKGIIHKNGWKYILTEKSPLRDIETLGNEELYDIMRDPHEQNNLIDQNHDIALSLREQLTAHTRYCQEKSIQARKAVLDIDTEQQMRALGYLQ